MKLRDFVRQYMAPAVFLLAYFLTVVLGNLVYASPWGVEFLALAHLADTPLFLPGVFGAQYWALLLCPFVITPVVVYLTRQTLGHLVGTIALRFPEISNRSYFILTVSAVLLGAYVLWNSGAARLFLTGTDAVAAVEARFELQGRLGFFGLVLVQAILPFLGYFAVVRSLQRGGALWPAVAVVVCFCTAMFLMLLNMKWPMLLFFCGISLAIFTYARRFPAVKAAIALAFTVVAYLLISTFILREVETVPEPAPEIAAEQVLEIQAINAELFDSAFWAAPRLAAFALNRMAVIYPYYLSTFANDPGSCGDLVAYMRPGAECRPSTFIYQRIFPGDGFEKRGTAPAAVHVTGFALGGWPIAIFALVAASFIMGLFSSLPVQASTLVATIGLVGGIAGYHWSQLPGEGPLVYDHGLIWPFLLIGAIVGTGWIWSRIATTLPHSNRNEA